MEKAGRAVYAACRASTQAPGVPSW